MNDLMFQNIFPNREQVLADIVFNVSGTDKHRLKERSNSEEGFPSSFYIYDGKEKNDFF